jgi:DsbC/DsbD-like thiol-disulfide interchange protein
MVGARHIGSFIIAALLAAGLAASAAAQAKKSESVVRAKVNAGKLDDDGKQTVTITLTMDKDWHTYANPVSKDKEFPGEPTQVTVTGKVKPTEVKTDYPKGRLVKDATVGDYFVYDDTVDIKLTIQRAKGDTGPLEIAVKVQACSDKQCLLPSTLKLNVP